MQPFFSLVVPCYNDGRYCEGQYIDRLLNNILHQGLDKDDIEVILVDDHSPCSIDAWIDEYSSIINIVKVTTPYQCCPGNSRQCGANEATGKWLCFADHDDLFYENALKAVKETIEKHNIQYYVYTDFNKVSSHNLDEIVETFRGDQLETWVHGKFYNVDNFWNAYEIHFIKDLKTHEDIALGNIVKSVLHKIGNTKAVYLKLCTYMWVLYEDSTSHSKYTTDSENHMFLERAFQDWVDSYATVLIEQFKKGYFLKHEILTLCIPYIVNMWILLLKFQAVNPETYFKENVYIAARSWKYIKDSVDISSKELKQSIQDKYSDLIQKYDEATNQFGLLHFEDWVDYLDKLNEEEL